MNTFSNSFILRPRDHRLNYDEQSVQLNYHYYSFSSFSHHFWLMVSHWSLSDSKPPQVTRTLLSILTDLSNLVVWMISTCSLISKSSSPCINPFVTVPRTLITTGITVTSMFHSFFNSLARSRYLSFFSISFSFTLWSAGAAKSTIRKVLFFLLIIIIIIILLLESFSYQR